MPASDRAAALLVLAALLGSVPVAAHGPPLDRQYDPLTHGFQLWLAPGALALEAPEAAAVPLGGDPGAPAVPVDFAFAVPVRVSLLGGIAAHLAVRVDGLVLPRTPGNALFEVAALRAGEPIEGTQATVAAPETPLRPGTVYPLDVATGPVADPLAAGDAVGLRVAFVGTAGAGGASLLLGPDASTANLTARVASLDDLGHDHPGWRHVRAQDFDPAAPTDAPVLDLEVHHGDPDQSALQVPQGASRTVRVLNAESPEHGAQHGPWGLDAPHQLRIAGAGLDERLRVAPGEVLLRSLTFAQAGTVEVRCEAACNRTGTFATIAVQPQGNDTSSGPQGAEVAINPGRFFEVNLNLQQGEALVWSFATDPPLPLKYDLHSHEGSQVTVHAEGAAPRANGTFRAPHAGVYSLLLENDHAGTAHVRYATSGGTPYAAPPAAALPLPAWVGLAAAGLAAALLRRRP